MRPGKEILRSTCGGADALARGWVRAFLACAGKKAKDGARGGWFGMGFSVIREGLRAAWAFFGTIYEVVPYRIQKPDIVVNGQRLVSPTVVPQRLRFCDRCNELAAASASLYTELALEKWWNWFSYPRFSCQSEAFMGCGKHPVESEIRFLDGRVEPFIRLPLTRWQRLTEWDALLLAAFFALVFAIIVELFVNLIRR